MQITKDAMAAHITGNEKLNNECPQTLMDEILRPSLPPAERSFDRLNDEVSTTTGVGFADDSTDAMTYYTVSTATKLSSLVYGMGSPLLVQSLARDLY